MSTISTRFAILTANEVAVIKTYVGLAERLETSFSEMTAYAGGEAVSNNYEKMTGVYSLGVGHIISAIVKHAGEWPLQEAAITSLCTKLIDTFGKFNSIASALVKTIEQSPRYNEFAHTLEQEIDGCSECPLCSEDATMLSTAIVELEKMIALLDTLTTEAEAMANSIQAFKESLMNEIQTNIKQFLQLETVEEMDQKLFSLPISDPMRSMVSTYMGIIRGIVLTVLSENPTGNLEDIVNARIHPNHLKEYNGAVAQLDNDTREKIESLVSNTKKGHVLFAQLESLHNWLMIFDQPLVNADKGVGQIRKLWIDSGNELQRINGRAKQVKEYSTLVNIVKSLNSALAVWDKAVNDAKTVNTLITQKY